MTSVRATGLRLRTQILLIVLGGAVLPLAIVGVWLTFGAIRSGERLLKQHLAESTDRFVAAMQARWEYRHGDLLLIAENPATVRAGTGGRLSSADSSYLEVLAHSVSATIPTIQLRDAGGQVRWSSTPQSRLAARRARGDGSAVAQNPGPVIEVSLPIRTDDGEVIGSATTQLALSALIPPDSARPLVPSSRLAVRDPSRGIVLLGLADADAAFPTSERFEIAGETWLAFIRTTSDPPLDLAIAAPRTPYIEPFRDVARVGLIALAAVSFVAIVLTLWMAVGATSPLEQLQVAADDVVKGDLDRTVSDASGPLEVRRVGAAFNSMTVHLRDTLDKLARRSALAAVGEFATSLSHDVRNSLTAVKVDLERATLREIDDPVTQRLVWRSLDNVKRLESTVSGALRIARSGNTQPAEFDLWVPLLAAVETVRHTFASQAADLEVHETGTEVSVRGDSAALQQMFANLLFNAAQAIESGGRAAVNVVAEENNVCVEIADDGVGMTADELRRLTTAFYSSKPNGTGLGLPIARQIVATHSGEITIDSTAGVGTVVRVRLPRVNGMISDAARNVTGTASAHSATMKR